jgi:hypothetical protein
MSQCKPCSKDKSIEIQTIDEIIKEIDLELLIDPFIDELGIIMSPPPPAVVVTQHKMGLSYKIIKPLFSFAITELNILIKKYKILTKSIDCIKFNSTLYDRIASISRIALLVRGDIPMVFNLRKDLIQYNIIDVNNELLFLKMLFTKHPKSPSGWQHRKWCLMFKSSPLLPSLSSSPPLVGTKCSNDKDIIYQKHYKYRQLTSEEILVECELCRHMSDIYPKNYYAWCHRLWLLQFMNRIELEREYDFTNSWLSTHVSDHSGANHLQQVNILLLSFDNDDDDDNLINKNSNSNINEEIFNKIVFIKNSLKINKNMILSRPGNDTLWYLRRGLVVSFIDLITSISCNLYTKSNNNHSIDSDELKYINDVNESIHLIRFFNGDNLNDKEIENINNDDENFIYLFSLINNDIDLNKFSNIMILILIQLIKIEANIARHCNDLFIYLLNINLILFFIFPHRC